MKKMGPKTKQLLRLFQERGGIVRFSEILKAGFHPDSLAMLEKDKRVEKMAHGLYRLARYHPSAHPDLVTASIQAPHGVVCLLSALSFHEATNEIPVSVDLAIPRGVHVNKIEYPPVSFYHFAPATWEAGIEKHKIDGHPVEVYSLAKTVADCFKFRNRIGTNVARAALKSAVADKKIQPTEIMRYAKICRVGNVMKPVIESML